MWCANCQQDVPAVARSAYEPLVCPRCHHELAAATNAVPSDVGVALDSFDQAAGGVSAESDPGLAPPRDWFEQEQTRQRLREIDRMLHSPYRQASVSQIAPPLQRPWPKLPSSPPSPREALPPSVPLRSVAQRAAAEPTRRPSRTQSSWLLSGLIGVGVVSFSAGVSLLGWSAAFQLQQLWQQGMTLTIGAEGLLILSLTWMAARLWRNSRRVNRQLHGVDQQLAEIEQRTNSMAGSQMASSQQYYHHFSQVANPHLLMANLQGQVDQLAARVAVQ